LITVRNIQHDFNIVYAVRCPESAMPAEGPYGKAA